MARVLMGIAIAGLALLSPLAARAADPPPQPRLPLEAPPKPALVTYDKNLPWRVGLIVGGSSFLAISYLAPCAKLRDHWCIPYAGPIMAAVKYHRKEARAAADSDGDDVGGGVPPIFVETLFVGVAALQALSTGLIVAGIVIPRREVTEPAYSLRLNKHVALTPVAAPSAVGLVASGSF